MALAGIGVDIVEIPRMARALERTPSMRTRLFTKDERDYCDSSARPAEHYAARCAARTLVAMPPRPSSSMISHAPIR